MPLNTRKPTVRIAVAPRMVELPESEELMKIWRQGETLEGFLEVVSAFSIVIDRASVSFQGSFYQMPSSHTKWAKFLQELAEYGLQMTTGKVITYDWQNERCFPSLFKSDWLFSSITSEQFLALDYHVLVHECEEEATIAGYTHFLPFQFTIPTLVATSNPDIHPLCKLLPPSITERTVHIQRPNQIFAQPHIGYSLSASVHCHSNEHMSGPEQCFHVEAEHIVVVLPFSSPKLLVGPEGKLTRFKSSSKSDVSISHWFSRRLAEVEVSKLQPVTVTYGTQSHHTQNHVLIHLKLLLQGTQDPRKAPSVLLSRVFPRIHIATIYSTDDLPSASAKMDTNSPRTSTYKRCTSVKLPRHKEKPAWSLVSTSKEGEEGQRSDASQIWTSAISVPLHTPKPLPPTFCSALAARKYLLKVSLKLDGTRHETFELETPLFITYSGPRRRALDDSEVVRGRNNDEQLLLNDDKASSFHVELPPLYPNSTNE